MKKILVTTDFSSNSKAGVRFAAQLASQAPYELIFYYVDDRSDIDVWTDTRNTKSESDRNADQQTALRKFVLSVYGQMGKPLANAQWIVNDKHEVDASIVAYAKKINADFICMSTRGGGVLDKFMGTNAERLITTSPVPLLIVPHTYRSKPIRSVLYASDMEHIERELELVNGFAADLDAKVLVCHYEYGMDTVAVKKRLDAMSEQMATKKVSVHFRKFYAELSLSDHLKKDIRALRPSVLAMFTKQDRNWYERLFLSSKTAEMGFDTTIPMLVFRK